MRKASNNVKLIYTGPREKSGVWEKKKFKIRKFMWRGR
jgi:hypothetical protein